MGAVMNAATARSYDVVKERSFGLCEVCGKARATEVHHILHRSHGGPDSPENLLHVCGWGNTSGCHGKAHTDTHRYGNGWALRSGNGPEHQPGARPVLYRGRWVLLTADGGLVEQEVVF